jgi:hypothetical protein
MKNLHWYKKHSPKFASILGTSLAFLICLERARSFALAQTAPDPKIDLGLIAPSSDEDSPESIKESQIPLSEKTLKKFDTIRTKEQICKLVNNKIVAYYDTVSLVENCKQRLIEDSEFFNELVLSKSKEVVELPARLFRLIPFGEPLTREFITGKAKKSKLSSVECDEVEGKYATASGTTYYFIEGCKKRPFLRFYDLQDHNLQKQTIVSLDPALLDRIPTGKAIQSKTNSDESLLMKMDGDVKWSLLARANREGEIPKDDADSLKKIQNLKSAKNPTASLCSKFENRLVSFYSQIFFLESCQLRKVSDFGMKLQQKIEGGHPIIDLTSEEYRALRRGKPVETKELLSLLQKKLDSEHQTH